MNPLHWTRPHQFAWAVVCLSGAVLGVLLSFIHSPFFPMARPWPALAQWLSHPQFYWLWSLLGFLVSGLIFYAAQLFRTSN